MKRVALQNSKRFLLAVGLIAGLLVSIPVPDAQAVNDVSAACAIGTDSACPAQSPQEIYNLYGTTTNGTYWLNVNGTATQTYVILDRGYPDSGGWFLGMKGTKTGESFWYDSTQWTSQSTTLNPTSLSDDVLTEAKFNAFNYLPAVKIVGVFKDRVSYDFNANGSGVLGTNSFGGHTWKEDIASQSMFTRFTTNAILYSSTGAMTRYDLYRESNANNAKLVFAYQAGYAKYGFAYNNGSATYRWGIAFNNENDDPRIDSSDAQAGIGLAANSAASVFRYTDIWGYSINGGTGQNNGSTATHPSGFQIWGKMAAPSLATPGAISVTNQGSGSVQLSFAASSGASEYAIQYKTAGSNWNTGTTVRLTNPGATPTATLTGLATGSYDFRVFARATNNSSAGNSYLLAQSIDSTAPTVSSVSITSSPGADSIYGAGEVITATVTWSEAVTITGVPRMQIQGLTSKYLSYASGSGTTSTLFSYTVVSGDVDRDGIVILANALELNSGAITDGFNSATRSHSAIVASLTRQVDGTAPSSPTIQTSNDGTSITLTYGETLSASAPATSRFAIQVNGVSNTVTSVSISSQSIQLEVTFAIVASAAVTVAYTDPSGANDLNAIQDEAGNDAPSFSAASATNNSTATSNTTATISLNPASSTAVYRETTSIRVSTNTAGRVDFYMAGKIIANCRNLATSTNIATCSWRPAVHSYVNLTARFRPTAAGYSTTSTSALRIYVTKRSGTR